MTRQDRIIALIRTGVPALVGTLLALIIAQVPAVATYIDAIDSTLAALGFAGVSVTLVLQAVMVAAVIALYHWFAQLISLKWPAAGRWLMGSSKMPTYRLPAAPKVIVPVRAEVTPMGLQIKTESGSILGTVNLPTESAPKAQPPKYGS